MEKKTKLYTVLFVLAGVLAIPLIWAEQGENWVVAQGSLVAILALLGLAAWVWWKDNHRPSAMSVTAATYARALDRLLAVVTVGIAALVLNANRYQHWEYHLVARAIGFGIMVAGSAFMSGGLAGFLFGSRPDSSKTSGADSRTNLEEIADWLTKIILGAGLVSLAKLPPLVGQFSKYMGDALGEPGSYQVGPATSPTTVSPNNAPIALAIMGFFSTCGLLYGYLWTRYEATMAEDPTAGDASALDLVDHWLNGPPATDDKKRPEMMNAVKSASTAAKVRIFLRTEQHRRSLEEDANERSLPIFQALVEADTQEVFHRNRSQLAFALMGQKKDPKNPAADWNRALDLLNDAIRIRDRSRDKGWRDYELARAICQIHLDANFNRDPKQSSDPAERQSIRADLESAGDAREAALKMERDLIDEWEKLSAGGEKEDAAG
jgi:hypothetical protein